MSESDYAFMTTRVCGNAPDSGIADAPGGGNDGSSRNNTGGAGADGGAILQDASSTRDTLADVPGPADASAPLNCALGNPTFAFAEGFESYPAGLLYGASGSPWIRANEGRDGIVSTTWVKTGAHNYRTDSYTISTQVEYVKLDFPTRPLQLVVELWYTPDGYYVYEDFAEFGLGWAASKFDLKPMIGVAGSDHSLLLAAPGVATTSEVWNELDYGKSNGGSAVHNYVRLELDFCAGQISLFAGPDQGAPLRATVPFDGSQAINAFYISGGLNPTYFDDIAIWTPGSSRVGTTSTGGTTSAGGTTSSGGTTSAGGATGGGTGGRGGVGGGANGGAGGATGGTGGTGGGCPGTMCGSACSDLATDVSNCGACGRPCQNTNAQGVTCHGGLCDTTNCSAGWGNCTQPAGPTTDNGCETDLSTSISNCGACGVPCASGQRCSGGACVCDGTSCPSGCCNGKVCEAYASQTALMCGTAGATCGACTGGRTCQSGQCDCPAGQSMCSGMCVDEQTNSSNCGACDTACSAIAPSTAACIAGRCLVTLVSGQSYPVRVVVDAKSVYWTNYGGGTVMKVSTGGGTPTLLASGQGPSDLAVDATSVYWTNRGSGTVMKVSIDGGVPTTLASGQSSASGIAVDTASVYWTNDDLSGTVMKVPIAGGTPTTLASGQTSPDRIAVDPSSVYWLNYNAGTVMRVPTGGGTPTTLVSGQATPSGIAVEDTNVYWTNGDLSSTVMKVPTGGGTLTTLASGHSLPEGIAVDAASVFWINCDFNATVMKVPTGGGTPTTLASGQNNPVGIAVDATSVYWTNDANPSGTVMKLTPK